ncbi:MAG: Holliday junction branch migration protein RuvA [Verrucomicrobiaceae bacterium]|nr:MAG: Holliday junction branch migration protein RuvA [Verrucomicrobiaceae bacterium]
MQAMISILSGPVIALTPTSAVLDCAGVGYEALCTTRTLGSLQTGQSARLFTVLNVREDALTLFGFSSVEERTFFNQLTSVSGVGPKLALSLLSSFTPAEVQQAITLNQPATLARASGVGKRMAEKIIVELKDKIGQMTTFGPLSVAASTATHMQATDLTSALINLGYQPKTAEAAAAEALKSNPSAPFEDLFRIALLKAAA